MKRPDFIKHFEEIQAEDNAHYPGSDELLTVGSNFRKQFELNKLGIHHEILKPGRRSSWPHAESAEEEFVYVIEGHPDAWLNGFIYRLNPGDAVGFPSGTGIAHVFLNNTDQNVRLLTVGETSKDENKCIYPMHPKRNEEIGDFLWKDCPPQKMGPHDGLPDLLREKYICEQGARDGIQSFCTGAVIIQDEHVLVVERHPNDTFGGYFEFAGGSIDSGEDFISGLKRECEEELGIDIVSVQGVMPGFDFTSTTGVLYRQINFIVVPSHTDFKLNPKEHTHYRWVGKHDIKNLNVTPEIRKCLEYVFENLI